MVSLLIVTGCALGIVVFVIAFVFLGDYAYDRSKIARSILDGFAQMTPGYVPPALTKPEGTADDYMQQIPGGWDHLSKLDDRTPAGRR